MKPRVALFVDVQNIYYTTKHGFGRNFDYNALWAQVSDKYQIDSASAYAIASTDPKQRQFHHILRGIGFEVKLKPYIQRRDGSAKGDWDVGIALDVFELAPNVDRVVLLSGDGDFELLVERIKARFNTSVTLVSVEQLTAQGLIDSAQEYWPVNDTLLLG
ncbi:NYN domain-containing protein [Vibrio hippocampi]|uniref:NYN domain-containing protein n=1 Tax=Vibrio hippocampi TaxID=654686 RepID=A0ABM8ZMG2_9VIBR|nr:NYN domain-containing protein [Vibrio hippocampi]CAH0529699.1 hypothetical protein VHP8226_03454 [Vibrio hippocampi]